MENSWKTNCFSTLQSSAPSMASSSAQELRSQMETNTGYYSYPHGSQDLRPLFASMTNSGSHRSEQGNLGNSFLSLLSGPPSLLQCDFQDLPNPKSIGTSCKLLPDSNNSMVNGIGIAVPLTSSGLLSDNLSGQNLPSRAEFCPNVSSRAVPKSNCASNSVLHDLQSSDLAKVVICHMVPGNEKVKGSFPLSGEWHRVSPADTGKACGANIQPSQKMPVEPNSFISNQASSFMNGCPRIFCSNTSGYLLLSNTGLLGVVCSCHCFHMSVLKFCEHSGLYGVNPGDAIRMNSGETIAQWCKLYLRKNGIRVPGDQSEWDWPEGLAATAGLVKSSVPMPNISNNLSHLVHSFGGSVSSRQSLEGVALSKNLLTNQRNIQDGNNLFFKGLTGTPQNNLHTMADNLITERAMSTSKLVGSGLQDGCQSISSYIESMKNRNPSIIHPSLQDQRITGKESNFCRIQNAKDGGFWDAATSNIELRLGQPYQLGQTTGNSDLSAAGPPLLDTLVNPLKSLFPEQMIPNIANCREELKFRQSLHFPAGPSNPCPKRDQNQLDRGNNAFVISNAIDAARVEKFNSNLAQGSGISLLTNLNAPHEDNTRSRANNYMFNVTEHGMRNTLHSEPHSAKHDLANIPRNVGTSVERQLDMCRLGSYRVIDKAEGVSFVADESHLAKDLGFRIRKEMEISSSFNGLSRSSDPHCLTAHKTSCYSHQLSAVPPDAPDSSKYSNYPDKVLSFRNSGQVDHANLRPLASSIGSGIIFPSQAISKGIPVNASTYQTPAFCREECIRVSTHLPDDNLRVHALRQVLELSKQQHALPSLPMNRGEGRFDCSSYVQHSLVDTSSSGEQSQKLSLNNKHDVFEANIKSNHSGVTCKFGSDEGFASMTGVNSCCHLSTFKQGNALQSNEVDLKHQISIVPLCNEHPSLRSGKNITEPSEHERCCHKVPYDYFHGRCGYASHTNCLGRDFESRRVGSFPNAFKEQMGTASSDNAFKEQLGTANGAASMIVSPECSNNHIVPKDKTVSLDHRGMLNGKLPKNICHASQWRDVPSKVKGVSDVTRVDRLANLFDARRQDREQLGNTYVKCFNDTVQIVDSLKEHEISNISSGCSAPAVTQSSIEVNNVDSSTIDAGDNGCESNLAVDEGSGIDKSWSSNDAPESGKSAELLASTGKTILRKVGSSMNLNHQSSCSLLDKLKLLNSLTWRKGRNQIPDGLALNEKDQCPQNFERDLKTGKRKREMGLEILNALCPTSGPSLVQQENPKCNGTAQFPSRPLKNSKMLFPSRKWKNHTFRAKKLSRKRELRRLYNDNDREVNVVNQTGLNGGTDDCQIAEVSGRKKCKRDFSSNAFKQFQIEEPRTKYNSIDCLKSSSSQQVNIFYRKARPIVCGKYGEIADGSLSGNMSKPAKIVPLSRVLNSARRCTLPKSCNPKSASMRELKMTSPGGAVGCSDVFYDLKIDKDNKCHSATGCGKINDTSMEKMKKECSCGDKKFHKQLSSLEKQGDDRSGKDHSRLDDVAQAQLKLKSKEIRKRSIYELTDKGKDPSVESSSLLKINCLPAMKEGKLLKTGEDSKLGLCKLSAKNSIQEHRCHSDLDSDAFCCVCGSSNKDETNNLLECSQCSIKVHQACYGVSKLPKGCWCCRPCRTSSKDIVCVLCGYGGGAMTQALRSHIIVKSLLRAWNIETESRPKDKLSSVNTLQKDSSGLHCSGYGCEENSSSFVVQPENDQPLASAVCKMDMSHQLDIVEDSPCVSKIKVHNSITAALLDSATKQWVHMVCGLWTPGTRCPNVDTMSAFDVSGAARPRADVVCCMCKRAGGSCIRCRVSNCFVRFHPWCAHQKGLLQSEVEGVDNEKVGFYGRCLLHDTHPMRGTDPVNTEAGCMEEEESKCARTEGYKGRKRDGFMHNHYGQSKGNGGCLVPQEQLNAWVHINGQKSCTQGVPKLPMSDIEHDCRKEYARYKQAKRWKQLVVYKSGIHALGLYTSRFISRSEMVVEYVGEIVGLRVSDKRENEYQSGKKLQYKSACYFFKIDKEHIIDATCKGGIARFVNHSCMPNCVAKVISVRNEKKVVFFAERDIFPGEEITYDYHFNHEDEGKKIPCFCNSKNCRRYLN